MAEDQAPRSPRDHPPTDATTQPLQGDEIDWTDEDEAAVTRAWARVFAEDYAAAAARRKQRRRRRASGWHGVAEGSWYMVLNLNANQDNADWPKRTWDLDIHTVDELRAYLAFIGVSVAAFRRWPVYRWNVGKPSMEWLRDL
jgi:hypothetical protein